ncbi:MAG: hypothetical protein ACYC6M_11910 [Terriglobales bacterium]
MLTAIAWLEVPTPEQLELMIPFVALMVGLAIAVTIAIAIAHVKVRHKEVERDVLVHRLAYEQRMKELEIEALRLRAVDTAQR